MTSGGRFDHLWNEALHVIKPFRIPDSWTVDRSHDWGESKPFSNLWWAQTDGTAAELPDGRQFCPPAGSLILIGEWYGCPPDELNKGLNMSSTNVAKGVAWIDKRLAGEDVDEPEEIQIDGVTRGQLHIMHGICSDVILDRLTARYSTLVITSYRSRRRWKRRELHGCLLTKSPAPASMAHRYSLTCWKLLSKVKA